MFDVSAAPKAALQHRRIKLVRERCRDLFGVVNALVESGTGRARLCVTPECAIYFALWGPPNKGDGIVLYLPHKALEGRMGIVFQHEQLYWVEELSDPESFQELELRAVAQIPHLAASADIFAVMKDLFAGALFSAEPSIAAALVQPEEQSRLVKSANSFEAAKRYINPATRPVDYEEILWRMLTVGDWRTILWAQITS